MNEQFRWLSRLLNEHEVRYWADSGTLLGLMRSGDVLSYDTDIDFGMWIGDVPRLARLLPSVESAGYSVRCKYYRRLLFKVTFVAKKSLHDRLLGGGGNPPVLPVHIHIFHPHGEHAWSPQGFSEDPGRKPLSNRAKADSLVLKACARSSAVRLFIKRGASLLPLQLRARLWPFKRVSTVITWWIPRKFFEQLQFHEALGAWIPEAWQEYLTVRYGNWKTPISDWVYYRDDSSIRLAMPEALVGEDQFHAACGKPL